MLIEDKDISKSVDGMYNVFTYTPTNTSIQYQWSGIKKGSELPVQVVQRNDEGVVVDVFDFETDEASYWKAIKKFEELIEEKTKEQEGEEEQPQGQSGSEKGEEETKKIFEESLNETDLSEEEIEKLNEEIENLQNEEDSTQDSSDGDSDGDSDDGDGGSDDDVDEVFNDDDGYPD